MTTRVVASGLVGGLVVLSLVSAAPVPPDPQRDAKRAEQAYRDYLKAIEQRDEKALRRALSEDFTQTDGSGGLLDRDKAIKQSLVPVAYWRAEVKEVKARVYGGAAIVNAVYRMQSDQVGGGVPTDIPMRVTATFVRKEGSWVLVAEHETIIPEQ